MGSKYYYIYIMADKSGSVLYTGVTNNLVRRAYEHREKLSDGFTKKYNCNRLVYYEVFEDVDAAIMMEKQIKGGSRRKKIALIQKMNAEWNDLYDDVCG